MELQPLDEVQRAVSGPWAVGRAQFWSRAAQSAAAAAQWATAASRLLNLVDPLDGVPAGTAAWRQLAVATLDAAIRARDPEIVVAAAKRLVGRAWPEAEELDALRDVFGTAEALDAAREGAALGALLRQRYPNSAWAHYAAAHFAELAALLHGEPLAAPESVVASFERAAEIFDAGGAATRATHARLRAAVAQLTCTPHRARGRRALTEVAADVVPGDAHWLAFGRAQTGFWLDLVRATDWIADSLGAGARVPDVQRARAMALARQVVRSLGVRLTDAEQDRLRALGDAFDVDERRALERQLRGRVALEPLLARPLDELDAAVAVDEVAELADGFLALVDAWRGGSGAGRARGAVCAAVVDFLRAEPPRMEAAETLARAASAESEPAVLRPVFLALARACAQPDESLVGPITELVAHYARRAPAPSSGFFPLAAALHDAGFAHAAALVTRRAIEDGERDPAADVCVARAVQWAVREAGEGELLSWLEAGERWLGAPSTLRHNSRRA